MDDRTVRLMLTTLTTIVAGVERSETLAQAKNRAAAIKELCREQIALLDAADDAL